MRSQDERIMAALAHVTILLPVWGLVSPIVIWVTQRETSQRVAFQALQALVYQLLLVILWFVGMGCYVLSIFFGIGGGMLMEMETARGGGKIVGLMGAFFPFLILGVFSLIGLAYMIYGLVGAVQVFRGRDFRYLLIGRWVERYLEEAAGEG
ncbi:MAG: DUF4870 domain-containing protein [Anaerolineae bacterium]